MRKLILLFSLGLFSIQQANAQSVTAGPELGMNFTSMPTRVNGVNQSNGVRIGPKIGGVVDLAFSSFVSLQPGLFYSVKGAHEEYTSSSSTENGITTTHQIKNDYRVNYLEIPVNIEFKFGNVGNGQFFLGGGPYFGFALGGKVVHHDIHSITGPTGTSVTNNTHDYGINIGNDAGSDDIKGSDIGLNFNVGYILSKGLFFRGNYGLGLSNVMPGGDANNYIHNRSFTVSVGYLFGR